MSPEPATATSKPRLYPYGAGATPSSADEVTARLTGQGAMPRRRVGRYNPGDRLPRSPPGPHCIHANLRTFRRPRAK